MGEGPRKKKRRVKSGQASAAAGEEEEAEAAGGEAEASSVAQVLSQVLAGGADAEKEEAASGQLKKQFSRLFDGRKSSTVLQAPVKKTPEAAAEDEKEATEEVAPKKRFLTPQEKLERETRLVFIGNVPLTWDADTLRKRMKRAIGDAYTGPIKPIWFRSEPIKLKWWYTNYRDGHIMRDYAEGVSDAKNAYAEVTSAEAVPIVCKAVNGLEADSTHVLRADGVGASEKLRIHDRKKSVFVGRLPMNCSEDALRKTLGKAGEVTSVRIVRDKEAKACKGYAFVRFAERKSVKAALKLDGAEVLGREIRVVRVEDKKAGEQEQARCAEQNELHPAARRCLLNMQRKQRANIRKAKQRKIEAKKEGRISKRLPRAERKKKKEGKRVKRKKGK